MALLIVGIALIITGFVVRFAPINPLIGFAVGLGLGMIFTMLIIRKLGGKVWISPVAMEIFIKLTACKPLSYTIRKSISKGHNEVTDKDYGNIVAILKDYQFSPADAKEAATYTINRIPNASLEGKIKEAFRYLGNGHKHLIKQGSRR